MKPYSILVLLFFNASLTLYAQIVCGLNQYAKLSPEDYYYRYGGKVWQTDQNEIVNIINRGRLWPQTTSQPSVHFSQGGENAIATRDRLTAANDYRGAIFIDDQWLNGLLIQSGTSWSKTAVLAHEMGHIYYGHTYGLSNKDKWHREYEADFFAGYCLCNMGANLCEAQAVFHQISVEQDQEDFNSHPSLFYRLQAIQEGFSRAGCRTNGYNCGELSDIYVRNYSKYDITFEIENRRFTLNRGNDIRIGLSNESPILYLWECPSNNTCRWSEFQVLRSQDYTVKNSGYGNGLILQNHH